VVHATKEEEEEGRAGLNVCLWRSMKGLQWLNKHHRRSSQMWMAETSGDWQF